MKNLSTIISTYEERFKEQFIASPPFEDTMYSLRPEVYLEFLRQFAVDLVREAFAATKVEKLRSYQDGGEEEHVDDNARSFNQALSEVEGRQQEFINE